MSDVIGGQSSGEWRETYRLWAKCLTSQFVSGDGRGSRLGTTIAPVDSVSIAGVIMKDESKQRLEQDPTDRAGLGDDQGTRIGSPTPGSGAGKKTGAGSEAVPDPTESHDTEHRSKYGGGSRREDGSGQRTP